MTLICHGRRQSFFMANELSLGGDSMIIKK
jgi:hypothetical protein